MNAWALSDRADPEVRPLADRHYNRQKIGSPQFVPPGRCVVLSAPGAFWITSWPFAEYVKHAWPGAWICSAFRNEAPERYLSSDLVREAVAVTRYQWPDVPELGMITFVDSSKTRHKRDPGRCFRKAGFSPCGTTKGGLVALQLLPSEMPEPCAPHGSLFSVAPRRCTCVKRPLWWGEPTDPQCPVHGAAGTETEEYE